MISFFLYAPNPALITKKVTRSFVVEKDYISLFYEVIFFIKQKRAQGAFEEAQAKYDSVYTAPRVLIGLPEIE
jgi:hypothetical protein